MEDGRLPCRTHVAPVTCRGHRARRPTPWSATSRRPASASGRSTPLTVDRARHVRRPPARGRLRLERRADSSSSPVPARRSRSLPTTAAPRFASELPPGPFRARLADVTEIRTVLPVADAAAITRRAERRNGDDKVVARRHHPPAHRRGRRGDRRLARRRRRADRATSARATTPVTIVAPHVGAPEDGDAVDVALALAGVDRRRPPRRPGHPARPRPAGRRGLPPRAGQPGRGDRGQPARARSTTSTRSSSTTCASPCGAPARSCAMAATCWPPPCWRGPSRRCARSATSPARPRDLDVQVLEWDGQVAALGGDDARRDLEPLRRQLVADRAAAHDDAEPASRRRRRPPAPRPVGGAAGEPDGPDARPDRAPATRSARSPRNASARPNGASSTTAGRSRRRRPAEHVHELRKDAKKLRYLLECFGGAARRRASARRSSSG